MKQLKFVFITILIPFFVVPGYAQVSGGASKHFEKNGLEFDYPHNWKTAEGSAEDLEYVELANASKTTQLIIYWQFGVVLKCQFDGTRKQVTRTLAERVASQIQTTSPPEASWQQANFGEIAAQTIKLHGMMTNVAVTADVYSLVVKRHFLNLVYLRDDNDASGKAAWETIRTTMKVAEPVPLVKGTNPSEGGVLNGRALRLIQPAYPAKAKAANAQGKVKIEVLIDEAGNVIAACLMSGHPLLREAAEQAARQSKFSSTKLNGKPVRVTGVIEYNFISQTSFP